MTVCVCREVYCCGEALPTWPRTECHGLAATDGAPHGSAAQVVNSYTNMLTWNVGGLYMEVIVQKLIKSHQMHHIGPITFIPIYIGVFPNCLL